MRRIAADCVDEDQEWILSTCYSRINRLSMAGVANKHAGIKGMPRLSMKEREVIMEVIMELKANARRSTVKTSITASCF